MKRVILCCLISAVLGCNRAAPADTAASPASQPAGLPLVTVLLNGRSFILEVAEDVPAQTQGLMYRDSMPADHGMIFVFPDEEPRNFWMKNTRIPLDILYLDKSGRIVSIASMKPFDITSVPSGSAAQFAIELNVGTASAAGVKVGDKIEIPAVLRR